MVPKGMIRFGDKRHRIKNNAKKASTVDVALRQKPHAYASNASTAPLTPRLAGRAAGPWSRCRSGCPVQDRPRLLLPAVKQQEMRRFRQPEAEPEADDGGERRRREQPAPGL